MPIRWRLISWFALVLGVILTLSGLVANALLERSLNAHVDGELRVFSARVHGSVLPETIVSPTDYNIIHNRLPPINEFASPGSYVQLIDAKGRTVVKSDSLGDLELPVVPALIQRALEGGVDVRTVSAGSGAELRVMASPLHLSDGTLVLEVAQSIGFIRTSMELLRWAILASVVLALAAATVSGGIIVRNALSPVIRVTRLAGGIRGGGDLSQRIDYSGPDDEIGKLAATFNHMLGDLDQAFRFQKQFVADASHELRGPLTVIRGNIDLLKLNLSPADRAESLRGVESETARMTKIVGDLLSLAEIDAGRPPRKEDIHLSEMVKEEAQRAQTLTAKHSIGIGRLEDVVVHGDRGRLQQLLSNFVDNAIKYTPAGGAVTISTKREGDWACLEVADTGIGIPEAEIPRIFDRFYRVDKARSRAGGGTGLGLSIVKAIAEQHGGRVTVKSHPGEGSTFAAWLKI